MQEVQAKNERFEMCFWFFFQKFLRFTIHKKGIDFDIAKAKAIQGMEAPTTYQDLKDSWGEFLCEQIIPFHKLLGERSTSIDGLL